MVCYGLVRGRGWQQEHYETVSRDARKRAQELRKAGFRVFVSALGMQVTKAGKVKMTMLTIQNPNEAEVPEPARMGAEDIETAVAIGTELEKL